MQPTPPPYGFREIAQHLVQSVVDTVVERPNVSAERKETHRNAVICTMMSFNPRDPVEIAIAGHCMVYDQMLHDTARDVLRAQNAQIKSRARPGVIAAGKMFLASVEKYALMQRRAYEELVFPRPPDPVEEPAVTPAPETTQPAAAEPEKPAPAAEPIQPAARQHQPKAEPAKPAASLAALHAVLSTRLSEEDLKEMVLAHMPPDQARHTNGARDPAGQTNPRPANGAGS